MLQNIKAAIKNSFIYGLGSLSAKLVGFILLPLYTRQLSISDYGTLSVLEISSQLILAIFGLALYHAFERWYWDPEMKSKQKALFFTGLMSLIVISGFMVGLFTIGSNRLSILLFKDARYDEILRLMAYSSAMQIVAVLPLSLMKMQARSILYTVVNIIQFTINLAATVYFIAILNQNIEGIYKAQIIGSGVFFIIVSKYIVKNINLKFELKVFNEMLMYSFPLMLSSISGLILTIADRFCINFITGLSDLGAYSLGYKISNSIKVLLITSVQLSINPMIYQMMNRSDNKRFYSKLLTYLCFGVMICVLGFSVFSQEIVHLLASNNPDYWDAYRVIPILSFAIFFGMCKDTTQIGLSITKKTKIIGSVTIFISVLNVALNILMISLLRSLGAAIAALLSNLLFFLIIYHYAQKSYRIPYEMKKIWLMVGLTLIIYCLSLINFSIPIGYKIMYKFFLIIALPVSLYFANFYEEIEMAVLKSAWRKWRNPLNWKKNISRIKLSNK